MMYRISEMAVSFWIVFALFPTVYTIENKIQCPLKISVAVGEEKTISCLHNVPNPDVYYWKHNETTIATIENGIRALPASGYNISDDGSLVILNASYHQQGRYSFVISTAQDERLSGNTTIVIYNKDDYVPTSQSSHSSESLSKEMSTESDSNSAPPDGSLSILLAILIPIVVICVVCTCVLLVLYKIIKRRNQGQADHEMDEAGNVRNSEEGDQNEPLLTMEEELQLLADQIDQEQISMQDCLDKLKQFLIDEKISEDECTTFLLVNNFQTTCPDLLQPWLNEALANCLISPGTFLRTYVELAKVDQIYMKSCLDALKQFLNDGKISEDECTTFLLENNFQTTCPDLLQPWLHDVLTSSLISPETFLRTYMELVKKDQFDSDKLIEMLLQYLKDKRITSRYYVDALLEILETGKTSIDYVADDFRYQVSRKEIVPRIYLEAMLKLIYIKEDAVDVAVSLLEMGLNEKYFPAELLYTVAEESYKENKVSSDLYEKLFRLCQQHK